MEMRFKHVISQGSYLAELKFWEMFWLLEFETLHHQDSAKQQHNQTTQQTSFLLLHGKLQVLLFYSTCTSRHVWIQ